PTKNSNPRKHNAQRRNKQPMDSSLLIRWNKIRRNKLILRSRRLNSSRSSHTNRTPGNKQNIKSSDEWIPNIWNKPKSYLEIIIRVSRRKLRMERILTINYKQ